MNTIYYIAPNDYLMHYGVLGMKWGHRKNNYKSTNIRSAIARKQNEKVDRSFKKWKENSQKRENAISLGKTANQAKFDYEKNKKDKNLKKQYKSANKEYKKSLKSNTTYRKGQIKNQVGSDLSRKYLSEAKKVKKALDKDPTNKQLKKQYNSLMSKHDVERAKARKAPMVASNRSQAKANAKRKATMTIKAVATTTAVVGGTYIVSNYLKKKGYNVNINSQQVLNAVAKYNKYKRIFNYIY